MKQLILTQFPWPWLPTLALVIFFTFFVGVIFISRLKSRQAIFNAASFLPLQDGIRAPLHDSNRSEEKEQ